MLKLILVFIALAVVSIPEGLRAQELRDADDVVWLLDFLADAPQSWEDCYVPLLLAGQSLEEVAASGRDAAIVLITTDERDSIWKLDRSVALAAADVAAGERVVRLRGRRYRYQGIGAAEVLRLLEKPAGSIPIRRIMPVPDEKSLEDLIAAFRGRK